MTAKYRVTVLAVALFSFGCDDATPPAGCTEGASVACACTNGQMGAQLCGPDGVLGACTCDGVPSVDGGPIVGDDGGVPILQDAGPPGGIAIAIFSPRAGPVYVRDTVVFQLAVSGAPEIVEAHVGDAPPLPIPSPYTFEWDTRTHAEGPVEVHFTARRAAEMVSTDPMTVHVDRTPPTIVARSPEGGATNVWLGTPFVIELDEPLAPSSVSEAWLRVDSAEVVGLPKTTSIVAPNRLEVRLDASPATLPSILTMRVTDRATDLAGNPVTPDTWTFEVPDWVVHPLPDAGSRRDIAVDPGGLLHVLQGSYDQDLRVSTWSPAGWTDLGAPFVDAAPYDLRLLMDASGNPVRVWIEYRSGSGNVLVAQRWDGAAWQSIDALDVDTATSISAARFDSTGRLSVAWEGTTGIETRRWSGSAWQPLADPMTVANVTSVDFWPDGTPAALQTPTTYYGDCTLHEWDGAAWSVVPSFFGCRQYSQIYGGGSAPIGFNRSYSFEERNSTGEWASFASISGAGGTFGDITMAAGQPLVSVSPLTDRTRVYVGDAAGGALLKEWSDFRGVQLAGTADVIYAIGTDPGAGEIQLRVSNTRF